jgi:hypothetical protein
MWLGPSDSTAHPRRAALPSGRLVFALPAPRIKHLLEDPPARRAHSLPWLRGTSGTAIRDVPFAYLLVDGGIAERLAIRDDLTMLRQLGALHP